MEVSEYVRSLAEMILFNEEFTSTDRRLVEKSYGSTLRSLLNCIVENTEMGMVTKGSADKAMISLEHHDSYVLNLISDGTLRPRAFVLINPRSMELDAEIIADMLRPKCDCWEAADVLHVFELPLRRGVPTMPLQMEDWDDLVYVKSSDYIEAPDLLRGIVVDNSNHITYSSSFAMETCYLQKKFWASYPESDAIGWDSQSELYYNASGVLPVLLEVETGYEMQEEMQEEMQDEMDNLDLRETGVFTSDP